MRKEREEKGSKSRCTNWFGKKGIRTGVVKGEKKKKREVRAAVITGLGKKGIENRCSKGGEKKRKK